MTALQSMFADLQAQGRAALVGSLPAGIDHASGQGHAKGNNGGGHGHSHG